MSDNKHITNKPPKAGSKNTIVKDKNYFDKLLTEEASHCTEGCIHTVFKNGRLAFLHHGSDEMTDFRKYCMEEEMGRPPTKAELRMDFEATIQKNLDEKISIPEEGDDFSEELFLVSGAIARLVTGENEWRGSVDFLYDLLMESDYYFFRLIPCFPTADSLLECLDEIEIILASRGLQVERSRTVASKHLLIKNLNADVDTGELDNDEIRFELPSFEKEGFELVNGVIQNEQNPLTFQIPSDEEKQDLTVGDVVKLGFEIWIDDSLPPFGERMHVEIVGQCDDFLIGSLLDLPISRELCDTDFSQDFVFTLDQVIDIIEKGVGDKSPEGGADFLH